MKFAVSILALLFFSTGLQAQHRYDESFKKMKRELNLTKFQENKIKKLDKEAESKINRIARSGLTSKKARIKEIEEERKNSIRDLLNPAQQERWQMILENKPRRGVTDMPNERTVKK